MLPASLVRQELLHKIGYGRRRHVMRHRRGGGFLDVLKSIGSTALQLAPSLLPLLAAGRPRRRAPRRRRGGLRAVDLNSITPINWPVGHFPRALITNPPLTASGRRRRRRRGGCMM